MSKHRVPAAAHQGPGPKVTTRRGVVAVFCNNVAAHQGGGAWTLSEYDTGAHGKQHLSFTTFSVSATRLSAVTYFHKSSNLWILTLLGISALLEAESRNLTFLLDKIEIVKYLKRNAFNSFNLFDSRKKRKALCIHSSIERCHR